MTAEKFWDLLTKKLSGEAAVEELAELSLFLESNIEWKHKADILSSLWQQSIPSENLVSQHSFAWHLDRMKNAGVNIDSLYYDAKSLESVNRKKIFSKKWFRFAAAAIIIGGVFFIALKFFSNNSTQSIDNPSLSRVTTKPGSRTQLQLPDGSKVWLNASSNLTYDKNFGRDLREVNLTGEAFFDVVKDPAHPFIIHTKVVDVKVLGTEFNVKAYPDDKITETSLIRGSVELTVKNRTQDKIYLKPNEKIIVQNNVLDEIEQLRNRKQTAEKKEIFSLQQVNYNEADSSILETSWVQNKLVFQENETFREVAVKMERWYGVRIYFENEDVANSHIFGSFTTETVAQALEALKEGFRFNYRINGNTIVISP